MLLGRGPVLQTFGAADEPGQSPQVSARGIARMFASDSSEVLSELPDGAAWMPGNLSARRDSPAENPHLERDCFPSFSNCWFFVQEDLPLCTGYFERS